MVSHLVIEIYDSNVGLYCVVHDVSVDLLWADQSAIYMALSYIELFSAKLVINKISICIVSILNSKYRIQIYYQAVEDT
jgi:hypothetical protein